MKSAIRNRHAAPQPGLVGRVMNAARRMAASASYSIHLAQANAWRSQYNPLRSLTMARAVLELEAGERGEYASLQWLYRYMERRDAVLGALLDRRAAAIKKLDWQIKVPDQIPDGQAEMAQRQARALRAGYDRLPNLRRRCEDLVLASFRGYAHLEKVRGADGRIAELRPVEQWFWVRDGVDGEWQYNPAAKFGVRRGEAVDLDRFLVREVARPINEVALIAFVRKALSQKDWDAFIETYGVPAIFLLMPEGLPPDREGEFQEIAEQIVSDARGVLPGGSDVKTVDNGARGVNPFRQHLDYQDEQVVMRGTGGKLTMIAAATGLGSGLAEVQERVFDEIAQAEAEEISELFQQQLDHELLMDAGLGDEPQLAYWQLAARDEADTAAFIDGAVKLRRAGYEVAARQIAEVTGYLINQTTEPVGERVLNRAGPAADAVADDDGDDVIRAATELLGQAHAEDTEELAELLREALRGPDTELPTALEAIRDYLPELVTDSEAATEVWERLYAAALVDGFSEGDAAPVRNNCGTGAGGFQGGNKCGGQGKGTSREGKTKARKQQSQAEGRRDTRSQSEIVRHKAVMTEALERRDRGDGGLIDLGDLTAKASAKLHEAGGPGGRVRVEISPQHLRHQEKSHGGESERLRGQKALTDDDFIRRLPLVVLDPDTVTPGTEKGKDGQDRFEFSRRIHDQHTVVVEVRTGGGRGVRGVPITQIKNAANGARPMDEPPAVTSLTVTRAWLRPT